jgi:plastocyanin
MSEQPPQPPQRPRSATLPVLPLVVALAVFLALAGMMVGAMAFWHDDHMAMHGRGSAGADQTPVVAEASAVTVEMRDYEFFPAKLTVDAGSEITWTNRDSVPHNAVADGGAFDTGRIDKDESASATLDEPGVFRYVCTYHSGMEATVTVR